MSQFCSSKCGELGLYLGQEAVLFSIQAYNMWSALCVWQVSSQSAGWGDGALSRPQAGNWTAEEEAGRAGGETHSQGPGTGQVTYSSRVWRT